METIHTVMLNILVIVFLTTVLDLLLPESAMRGYIKMAMGFFVVLTILQPVIQLAAPEAILQQWQLSVPASVRENSLAVQSPVYEQQQKELEQLYTEKLNGQVYSLLLLTTELENFRVDCSVSDQCLQQIQVWVPDTEKLDCSRIQQALSGYYGLNTDQIIIARARGASDGLEEHE